jgi:hypothetical protein
MFALLLAQAGKVEMQKALTFWQQYRQGRIEAIMALNKQIDLRRMPSDEKTKGEMEEMKLEWLSKLDLLKAFYIISRLGSIRRTQSDANLNQFIQSLKYSDLVRMPR